MIIFDTFRRYLEYKGYDVNYVSNFTDVDDKIIKKAIEEGTTAEEISQRYIKECKKDMHDLNIEPATTHPLATQEIDGMIEMIKTLIDKGYAYDADGTVYYRTRKFKDYGKLSKKNIDDLEAGHRDIKVAEKNQRKILLISCFGNLRKKENLHGHHHGVTEDRDGILNVQLCQRNI